jgi:hypothetical protein
MHGSAGNCTKNHCTTLNTEVICPFETFLTTCDTTRHQNPEDNNRHLMSSVGSYSLSASVWFGQAAVSSYLGPGRVLRGWTRAARCPRSVSVVTPCWPATRGPSSPSLGLHRRSTCSQTHHSHTTQQQHVRTCT